MADELKKKALEVLANAKEVLAELVKKDLTLSEVEYLEARMTVRYIDKLVASLLKLERKQLF